MIYSYIYTNLGVLWLCQVIIWSNVLFIKCFKKLYSEYKNCIMEEVILTISKIIERNLIHNIPVLLNTLHQRNSQFLCSFSERLKFSFFGLFSYVIHTIRRFSRRAKTNYPIQTRWSSYGMERVDEQVWIRIEYQIYSTKNVLFYFYIWYVRRFG